LLRALLFSIVFHLVILAGFQRLVPSKFTSEVTTITALQAKLASAKVTPVLPSPVVRRASPPSMPRSALRSPLKIERTAPKALDIPGFSASTAGSESAPVKPSTIEASELVATGEILVKPEISSDSLNLDGLRQYRLNLAREARRFKRYPSQARQRGWEGMVTIRIEFSPASADPVVSLAKGSGYDMLDAQALEMIANAARSASIPDSLRGRQFVINAPVEYRIDD
jgi:protein TonB